jgi:CubicO group peptidase (beta-lactamase class C family)
LRPDDCFDPSRLQRAYDLLDEAVRRRVIPGGVALVGVDTSWLPFYVTGRSVSTHRHKIEARADTLYDLASLTKVVATLPAVLLLLQEGLADPQATVGDVLCEWGSDTQKRAITLGQLLTHTSGLPADRDLHSHGWSPDEIVQQVLATPLQAPPGTRMTYSDLGYILLGEWVRRVTGESLDGFLRSRLYEPLGMSDTLFRPPKALRKRTAAGAHEPGQRRSHWGHVHDDNAHALGGVAGHAGLYSTADDLARYLDACWLPWRVPPASAGPLSPAVVRASLWDYTAHLGAHRGWGWTLRGDAWDAAGSLMYGSAFGHTGYTGTSLWVDPARKLKIILLTNRVHSGSGPGIIGLRRRFHNVVVSAYTGEVAP